MLATPERTERTVRNVVVVFCAIAIAAEWLGAFILIGIIIAGSAAYLGATYG